MDWNGIPLQPLAGGYSGETFLAGDPTLDPDEAVVVRVHRRSPERAAIDASLIRLVRGIVPVPEVLEFRTAEGGRPPVLVTRYCPGTPLDRLLAAGVSDQQAQALGRELGRVLAALSGIPFLRTGLFADPELRVTDEGMPTDLVDWARHYRDTGRLAAWHQRDWEALVDLARTGQDIIDSAWLDDPRFVLVHSDFNPKNILVDAASSRVVALLDWEFAYAGSRYADLGNLLRFDREPGLAEAVVHAYAERWPEPGGDLLLTRARAADLWALVELAGRTTRTRVTDQVDALLLAMARAADLHATP